MGKKLFTIPIKHQYEQACNAEALKSIGVPIAYTLNDDTLIEIKKWTKQEALSKIDFPDVTKEIIEKEIFQKAFAIALQKDINMQSVIY